MSDLATRNLEHILDGNEYELVADVPIFDQHDEYDAKGNLVRRFDPAKLDQIARTCNARRATGDLAPIGPGHTLSKTTNPRTGEIIEPKETDQPPIWGYVSEMKVGKYGAAQKPALLANFYMKRRIRLPDGRVVSGKEALAEFPRRSIEIVYGLNLIDWVAILRRTPARDLGLTAAADAYSRERVMERLQTAPWADLQDQLFPDQSRTTPLCAAFSRDGKLRYSMGDQMPDQVVNATSAQTAGLDAASQPNNDALTPEEGAKAMKYFQYGLDNHPAGKYMSSQCAGKYDATAGAAVPGPTSSFIPGSLDRKPTDVSSHNASDASVARYQREVEALRAEIDRRERVSRYERDLHTLEAQGLLFDMAEELADCQTMTLEQFENHKKRMAARYQRSIVGGDFIQTRVPAAGPKEPSAAQANRAKSIASRENISFEAALAKVMPE